MTKDLFQLHVYRLKKDEYLEKRDNYVKENRILYNKTKMDAIREDDSLAGEYGGAWEYNEIIGYIKIYQWGNKIRCEYWETNSLRKVRTRRKQLERKTDKYCDIFFSKKQTNSELIEIIKKAVQHCKNRVGKKRHIDSCVFDTIVYQVNWKKLLA